MITTIKRTKEKLAMHEAQQKRKKNTYHCHEVLLCVHRLLGETSNYRALDCILIRDSQIPSFRTPLQQVVDFLNDDNDKCPT
jgi:hypothetical protein